MKLNVHEKCIIWYFASDKQVNEHGLNKHVCTHHPHINYNIHILYMHIKSKHVSIIGAVEQNNIINYPTLEHL